MPDTFREFIDSIKAEPAPGDRIFGVPVHVVEDPVDPRVGYIIDARALELHISVFESLYLGKFPSAGKCGCECRCHADETADWWPGPCEACCDPELGIYECRCADELRRILRL